MNMPSGGRRSTIRRGNRNKVIILISNGCRMIWWMIASTTYIIVSLFLGFFAGLLLLFLLRQPIIPSLLNNSDGTKSDSSTTTMTNMLIQQAEQNNKDETNQCVIPLGTTVVNIRGFRLVVHNKDNDFLSSQIIEKGFWEIRDVEGMAALSPSMTIPGPVLTTSDGTTMNTTFYDIGANIGYYSFLFAEAGYTVLAFEPETANVGLFRASLCLNQGTISQRITLYEYAISNINQNTNNLATESDCKLVGRVAQRTRKYLYSIPRINCDPTYKCLPDKDLICQTNVPITTLQNFVSDLQPNVPLPNIIKLDVEGQELNIIESIFQQEKAKPKMSNNIIRRIEPMMIQYENTNGRNAPMIASLLSINGFTIGTKRGHDYNTIAEYKPPKNVKKVVK
jgi:FkbM family methyltransferase